MKECFSSSSPGEFLSEDFFCTYVFLFASMSCSNLSNSVVMSEWTSVWCCNTVITNSSVSVNKNTMKYITDTTKCWFLRTDSFPWMSGTLKKQTCIKQTKIHQPPRILPFYPDLRLLQEDSLIIAILRAQVTLIPTWNSFNPSSLPESINSVMQLALL